MASKSRRGIGHRYTDALKTSKETGAGAVACSVFNAEVLALKVATNCLLNRQIGDKKLVSFLSRKFNF